MRSAAASSAARLLAAAALLWLREGVNPDGLAGRLALLAALLDIGSIALIWVSLRVRLREIDRGEEEEASQY
ncbi:MAG: hypothetical protein HFG01_02150 [Oscillibacter sp.]|nr:hypothetical protein [Oscillibacter sp.]